MCFEDQVQCKKEFEHCIGGCAGDATSNLMYDFATTIAIADLNPDVVGEDGFASAHANCSVKTGVVEVDLFEGGDSYAAHSLHEHAPLPQMHSHQMCAVHATVLTLSPFGCKRGRA